MLARIHWQGATGVKFQFHSLGTGALLAEPSLSINRLVEYK
jgi:hypothetical protein